MRQLDKEGLKQCSYQAEIFSKSLSRCFCSSKIFLRRYFHSRFAFEFDFYEKFGSSLTYDEDDCFKDLIEEYGDCNYGKIKFSEPVLHYIGYITRYICYTREITSLFFYRTFGLDDLINHYEVFHTQSEEYVISELLNIHHLNEDVFDEKKRLIAILTQKYKDKGII